MPAPIEIIINSTATGGGLKQASGDVDQLNSGVQDASVNLGKFANSEAFGISHREFSRIAMGAIVAADAIGGLDKQTSQLVHTGEQLASAFLFGGPLGVAVTGVAIGIGSVIGNLQAADAMSKTLWLEAIKNSVDFAATLTSIGNAASGVASGIQKTFGVTSEQANMMAKAASQSPLYVAQLEKVRQANLDVSYAGDKYNVTQKAFQDQLHALYPDTRKMLDALDAENAAQSDVNAKIEIRNALVANAVFVAGALTAEVGKATATDDYYQRSILAIAAGYGIAAEQAAAYQLALQHLDAWMHAQVATAVGAAMVPTETKLGPDTWDEARKRLEAVANGTPPEQYGAGFAAAFQKLGIAAKEAAADYKDFSLMADPKGMAFFKETGGFDQLVKDSEHQLDSFIGKEKIQTQVSDAVWSSMSDAQRKALADMGISKLSDVDKMALGIRPDPEFGNELKGILDSIPKSVDILVNLVGGGAGAKLTGGNANAWGGTGEKLAGGGAGMVTQSGYVWIDKGERYWASGTQNQVAAPGANVTIIANVASDLQMERLKNKLLRELGR